MCFILTKWYVKISTFNSTFQTTKSFILTKWYVKKIVSNIKNHSFKGFILTKWYVKLPENVNLNDISTVLY